MNHKFISSRKSMGIIGDADFWIKDFDDTDQFERWINGQIANAVNKFKWFKRGELHTHQVTVHNSKCEFYEVYCYDRDHHKFSLFFYPVYSIGQDKLKVRVTYSTMSNACRFDISERSFLFTLYEAHTHCTFPVMNNLGNHYSAFGMTECEYIQSLRRTFNGFRRSLGFHVQEHNGAGITIRTMCHTYRIKFVDLSEKTTGRGWSIQKNHHKLYRGVYKLGPFVALNTDYMSLFTRAFYEFLHLELIPTIMFESDEYSK